MIARIRSLAVTPSGSAPSTLIAIVLGLICGSVCVARTCSTSLVPMPKAIAPNAPGGEGGGAQAVEGLGAGDLVHEVQVDEEQGWLALLAAHHMGVPDLLRERARRAAHAVHLLRLLICVVPGPSRFASQDSRRQYQYMINTTACLGERPGQLAPDFTF